MKTMIIKSNYNNVRMTIPEKQGTSIRNFELAAIDRIIKKEFGKGKEFYRNHERSIGYNKTHYGQIVENGGNCITGIIGIILEYEFPDKIL